MSYRDLVAVKEPVLKRLKIDNNLKIVTSNSNPSKEKIEIHSHLESLPSEILLKIFENIKPKIKELISLSQVCRRLRLIAHDQSFWKNVNLFPKNSECWTASNDYSKRLQKADGLQPNCGNFNTC